MQHPVTGLGDVPPAVVFHRVMPTTQVCEVRGRPAFSGVKGVVDIAPVCGCPTSGESAVLVPHRKQPAYLFGRPVPVHTDHRPGYGVEPREIPVRRCRGESLCGVGADGSVPGEFGWWERGRGVVFLLQAHERVRTTYLTCAVRGAGAVSRAGVLRRIRAVGVAAVADLAQASGLMRSSFVKRVSLVTMTWICALT